MTSYQVVGLAIAALGIILSFYTIVNRQNTSFKEELNRKFDTLNSRVEEADKNSAVGFEKVSGQFQLMTLQINKILAGDVIELRERLGKIESGQDEWTKELRERTHQIGNMVEKQGYEIELLKMKCKDLPNK